MAKSQNVSSFRAELLKFSLYKRNQGRLVRQLTAAAAAVLIFFGAYTLSTGPLSSYINSYQAITARYKFKSGTPDVEKDARLLALAVENGGVQAEVRGGRYRELIFHFPTSRRWATDPDLVKQMKANGEKFRTAVISQYQKQVSVSEMRSQTRKAPVISIGIPVLVCALGFWIVFRAVNYPRFADFLVSVEAEMDKVSWPGKPELYRSTAVVVTTMFLLGFMLLTYDVFWKWFFEFIGFLRIPTKDKTAEAALCLMVTRAGWLSTARKAIAKIRGNFP